MSFRFDQPELLWLLLLAVPVIWLGQTSLSTLDPARRWTAIGLRLLVLLTMAGMLAGFQVVQRHDDLTVIAVIDQSESVRRFAQHMPATGDHIAPSSDAETPTAEQWIRNWLRQSGKGRRSDDLFGLVTYDNRPTVRALPSKLLELDPGTVDAPAEGTNTADAIRAAMAIFPADSAGRLLLVSDGNDTTGDVLTAAREAAAAGITIDVLPINYHVDREVIVENIYAPAESREGRTVAIRVVLRATQPARGRLHVLHDDLPIDLDPSGESTGMVIEPDDWSDETPTSGENERRRYITVRQIDLPLAFAGVNKFQAVFEPNEGEDGMIANNKGDTFTLVTGKGRLLFVNNVPGESGMILPKSLERHGVELDIVPGGAMPARLTQLQRYDAVIFQNVPADLVSPTQQRMLARYVNDMGGGFIMIGGPDSFGAGAWTNTPVDMILPVSCRIPSQTILPSGALVVVLDRSGSMASPVGGTNRTQQEVANEAAILAISTLYPQDLVGVVAFDHSAKIIVDLDVFSDPGRVMEKIRSIHPGGGTQIYSGLEQAYYMLEPIDVQDAAVKHVILLTDGISQEGNYIRLVGNMMKSDITLSTIGVGDGHDAQLLNQLAMMGGGTYHPVVNPNDLPQVFIKEAKTIRKNLIREEPFIPQLYTTGSPVMASVTAVPELKGLVLTGRKHDPRVFLPMVGKEDEPVFAHWQVGLGRTAAFTSDATNRWATYWLAWHGYDDFWLRLTRYIARPTQTREVDVVASVDGERLTIRLDAVNSDIGDGAGSFSNFLSVRGGVMMPDGSVEPVTLEQRGPGIYETELPATQAGNYIANLVIEDPEGNRRTAFAGAGRKPGSELRRFDSDLPVLKEIQEMTGGRWLDPQSPGESNLYDRTRVFESRSIRPLWRKLLVVLLALVMLDIACRRIAWDGPGVFRWLRERLAVIRTIMQPRQIETAEATLATLKQKQQEVGQRLAGAGQSVSPARPSSKRKFEAATDVEVTGELAGALGGADDNAGSPTAERLKEPEDAGEADQVDTTSRLMEAKRRARRRMSGED